MITTYDNAKLVTGPSLPHRVWRKVEGGAVRVLYVNNRLVARVTRAATEYILVKEGVPGHLTYPKTPNGFKAAIEEALA